MNNVIRHASLVITVKSLVSTGTNKRRVRACLPYGGAANSVTMEWDYLLSGTSNYDKAAQALCAKLGLSADLHRGDGCNSVIYFGV
jgi:hypothetical protein